MQRKLMIVLILMLALTELSADENSLTEQEKKDGWILLFDGQTTKGWMTTKRQRLPKRHVQNGALNPHPCDYMLVSEKPVERLCSFA
jgi:hypothetical protein